MGFISRLRLVLGAKTTRNSVELADLTKAWLLFALRRNQVPADEEAFVAELRAIPERKLRQGIQEELMLQIEDYASQYKESTSNHGKPPPFFTHVASSSIPTAGLGTFLSGAVDAGTVVGIHPGVAYAPHNWPEIPNYPELSGNSFLSARFDRVCIDGAPFAERSLKTMRQKHHQKVQHPLAAVQWSNHPAPPHSPNILPLAIDIPADRASLLPLLAISNCRSTTFDPFLRMKTKTKKKISSTSKNGNENEVDHEYATGTFIKTLAYVAMRPLCDEELFLNYRLNPRQELPAWYVPVDVEEDNRRWSM